VRQKIRTRQFDRPVQMTGRIARIVKVAPQFTLRSQGPSAPKRKKVSEKRNGRQSKCWNPAVKTLTSRRNFQSNPMRCTRNRRFPINRLQPPINRTGRMMMTSSAGQFHPFTISNLPPRHSFRCGTAKDAAITNHKKMDDATCKFDCCDCIPVPHVPTDVHLRFSGGCNILGIFF
jgi:hypothetical protein